MSKTKKSGKAARLNNGKVELTQCPPSIVYGIARVLMKSSMKYGGKYEDYNWKEGAEWSVPYNSLKRHADLFFNQREDIDDDTGELHLFHMACNVAFLIEYYFTYKEGDDRPEIGADLKELMKGLPSPVNKDE